MYHTSGPLRRSSEPDEQLRREINTQQLPAYNNVHSPTQFAAYSPTNGTHPQSPYNQYPSSRPSTSATMSIPSAISPRLGPPPSPKFNGPSHNSPVYSHRQSSSSAKFYDPVSEYREPPAWNEPRYPTRSPVQVRSPITDIVYGANHRRSMPATPPLSLIVKTPVLRPRPITLP